jgi:hypothetical protein
MSDLDEQRQQTIDRLTAAYADDRLELEELERRVDSAERAGTSEALVPLVADLPAVQEPARAGTALVPAGEAPEQRSLVTVFGSVKRDRAWTVPRRLRVVSVFGGTDLDFRKARLGPGTTEVRVVSVMSGVRLLVPTGLPVEVDGVGILGSFDERVGDPEVGDESTCRLRVSGLALLSGVEIEDRLPGESRRQARRRRKQARHALEQAATDRLLEARRHAPTSDTDER